MRFLSALLILLSVTVVSLVSYGFDEATTVTSEYDLSYDISYDLPAIDLASYISEITVSSDDYSVDDGKYLALFSNPLELTLTTFTRFEKDRHFYLNKNYSYIFCSEPDPDLIYSSRYGKYSIDGSNFVAKSWYPLE